jgi:hypothetical protein
MSTIAVSDVPAEAASGSIRLVRPAIVRSSD